MTETHEPNVSLRIYVCVNVLEPLEQEGVWWVFHTRQLKQKNTLETRAADNSAQSDNLSQ